MLFAIKLQKADGGSDLGSWQGMHIIAIGPKGGKIVGYAADGTPYYAGTPKAATLSGLKQLKHSGMLHTSEEADENAAGEWMLTLGIPSVVDNGDVTVSDVSGQVLKDHFGVAPHTNAGKTWHFKMKDLLAHLGEPLKPKAGEQQQMFAAEAASGQLDKDPFPDLSTLKQQVSGKYAGSHGNLLFTDPKGKKWIFKGGDPAIARAEEAACRIGALIMGDRIPPAKFVKVDGKSGTLVGEVPGTALNDGSHSNPPLDKLQKCFNQVVMHQVVDWLTSNHDGHAGNFLEDGSDLNAIDKGQAWKFFGKDKLDVNYSPNPSKPIYVRFWNAFMAGDLKGDPVKAAAMALDAAEQISVEQFKAIVEPYVKTASKQFGFDADKRMAEMTARLTNLRSDFETFLGKVLNQPGLKIPSKSADNFETMPEAKTKTKDKTVSEPVAKPALASQAPAPVSPHVAGWPMTKGKVTVHHPGDVPSTGAKWPSGYPGPGFSAVIDYKGKKYSVLFTEKDGAMRVAVAYPDDSVSFFTSPNQASDSFYLYEKGLPLTMSGTEKKKQGISYPANKAFGITAFAAELAQAKGGDKTPPPPSAQTVTQLEEAKVVTPEQPALKASTGLLALEHGALPPLDALPIEVQELAKMASIQVSVGINKNYAPAIPPGVPVKATTADGVSYIVVAAFGQSSVLYHAFRIFEDGDVATDALVWKPSAADVEFKFGDVPEIMAAKGVQLAKGMEQEVKNHMPPAGPPPVAELPKTAEVPKDAPKYSAGPVPSGTVLKVKKKGLGEVKLLVGENGSFTVQFQGGASASFESLSAASDHVWVNAQGFKDVAQYKSETGKTKVASGGGWKFWGVTPKADPQTEAPPKSALPSVTSEELSPAEMAAANGPPPHGSLEHIDSLPAGTTAVLIQDGHDMPLMKDPSGVWKTPSGAIFHEDMLADLATSPKNSITFSAPEKMKPGETKAYHVAKVGDPDAGSSNPGKSNWEWFDDFNFTSSGGATMEAQMHLDTLPVGSQLAFSWEKDAALNNAGNPYLTSVTLTKQSTGDWGIDQAPNASPMSPYEIAQVFKNALNDSNAKVSKPLNAPAPKPAKVPITVEQIAAMENGTTLTFKDLGTDTVTAVKKYGAWEATMNGTTFNIDDTGMVDSLAGSTDLKVNGPSKILDQKPKKSGKKKAAVAPKIDLAEVAAKKAAAVKVLEEKKAAATKVADWAKSKPVVSDAAAKLALSYVQKQVGPMTVRVDGDHVLVRGEGKAFMDLLDKVGGHAETVETPAGIFYRTTWAALGANLDEDNKPGKTISGPDGGTYPAGTKFKTNTIVTKTSQALESEPGFYKLAPHKTDNTLMALKVKGAGAEQTASIKAWAEKYGLGDVKIDVGTVNTVASVPKIALDKVWKTEDKIEVTLPDLPPVFISKPLPSFGGGVEDHAPGVVNTSDLAAMEAIVPSAMGHAVRLGKYGIFWNNQVYVRKVAKADGTLCYEVFGELQHMTLALSHDLKSGKFSTHSTAGTKVPHVSHPGQTVDKETGVQKENGDGPSAHPQSALVGATAAGSDIRIINASGSPTLHGNFSIRIDADKDLTSELGAAFQKMGLDVNDAMSEPTHEDDRKLMKLHVARAVTGVAANKSLRNASEEALDKIIASKGAQKLLEGAEIKQAFEGKQVTYVDNLTEAKKEGVAFLYSGMPLGDVFARIREGVGMASNKRKIMNGIPYGSAASPTEDVNSGGVAAVFTRFGNTKSTSNWGYKCGGPLLIFKPEMINRTDWYSHDHDAFGSVSANTQADKPQSECFSHKGYNNEVCFEDGVSHKEIAGVVVRSPEQKTELIKWLQAEKIDQVNGIPLDQLIMIHAGESRKTVVEGLIGLQKGATS